jgi:hypothetical protein
VVTQDHKLLYQIVLIEVKRCDYSFAGAKGVGKKYKNDGAGSDEAQFRRGLFSMVVPQAARTRANLD